MLSRLKTGLHKGVRRIQAAHGLHHDLDFFIFSNCGKIADDFAFRRRARKIPQIQNVFHLNLLPHVCRDHILVLFQHLIDAGSYRSISHYRYLDHILLLLPSHSLASIFAQ